MFALGRLLSSRQSQTAGAELMGPVARRSSVSAFERLGAEAQGIAAVKRFGSLAFSFGQRPGRHGWQLFDPGTGVGRSASYCTYPGS